MPLYEIVLEAHGRQEVRLTDKPLAVGDTFQIGKTAWCVVREVEPSLRAKARYEAELQRADRGHAPAAPS